MIYYNKSLGLKYYDIKSLERILAKFTPAIVGRGKHKYINMPFAFDIEDTSFDDISLMYHHQLGIMDINTKHVYVVTGRTEEELLQELDILSNWTYKQDRKAKLLIYVHNLSHEYFFLRGILDFDSYFVTKQNMYLYAIYKNIEFRCSYILSNCGLASLHNYVPNAHDINKMVGDLDYSKIRHPKSYMSDEEIGYCLQDVRIVCKYIDQKITEYGDISKIPLTKTKGVYNKMINYCIPKGKDTMSVITKNRYIREIAPLKFHNPGEMILATNAFMGGHTAGNPFKINKIIKDVTCWDYSSSYGSICCYSKEFPKSYIGFYSDKDEAYLINEINLNHAFICQLEFNNIRPKHYVDKDNIPFSVVFDNYIPSSKCTILENEVLNNGKVVQASKLSIYCTNIDYDIYNLFYEWDSLQVKFISTYTKGYLPRSVISFILDLYRKKCIYKNDEEHKLDYILAKEDISAASYGANVKSPLMDTIQYDTEEDKWRASINGQWLDDAYDLDSTEGYSQYYIDKTKAYNRKLYSGQITIPYVAAIFIPAIGRRNLSYAIFNAGVNNMFVYSDTDSLDAEGDFTYFVDSYNNRIESLFIDMCNFYNFPLDCWKPDNKPMGYFTFDGHYKYMKIVRAKTYICIDDEDYLHITVAGLNKLKGCEYLAKFDEDAELFYDNKGNFIKAKIHNYEKVFNAFTEGLYIPAEYTGKLAHNNFRDEHIGTIIDEDGREYKYHIKGGVNLSPIPFEIKEDEEYAKLMKLIDNGHEITYYN